MAIPIEWTTSQRSGSSEFKGLREEDGRLLRMVRMLHSTAGRVGSRTSTFIARMCHGSGGVAEDFLAVGRQPQAAVIDIIALHAACFALLRFADCLFGILLQGNRAAHLLRSSTLPACHVEWTWQ